MTTLKLSDVTMVGVDCTDRRPLTVGAMLKSSERVKFGERLFLSDKRPTLLPQIKWVKIPKISNINEYNLFMFKHLGNYIETDFCLTVQDHAYVANTESWTDEFLEYDYIGAPWQVKEDAYICHDTGEQVRVGNGGFSLRSQKILKLPITYKLELLQEQNYYNEDGNLCVYHRKFMLERGIKYAPVELASRFSYENPVPENEGLSPFGFHRRHPDIERGKM